MGTVYANESEAALHEAAIDALAGEMHRPAAEIKTHYERELQRLSNGARRCRVCQPRSVRSAWRR